MGMLGVGGEVGGIVLFLKAEPFLPVKAYSGLPDLSPLLERLFRTSQNRA